MTFSPQQFLSNMKKHGGPARNCKFRVVLPIPRYIGNFVNVGFLQQINDFGETLQDLTATFINNALGANSSDVNSYSDGQISRYLGLQCETAELPGVSLATTDVKIYGPTYKIPFQKQFSDINLTFIATNDFYERKLFDRWIEAIMPNDTNNLRFPKGERTRYMTDITIIQYDDSIKQIYAIKLIDAFPTTISPMALNWSDDSVHRLSVTFAYQRYETIYQGKYDIGEAIVTGQTETIFDQFINQFSVNMAFR